jgi:glycosyltransferase involved in cell wall biosynthesis
MGKKKTLPFVSIITPTFNRRPFIPFIIKCFENQTYPREKMEWIIVDDGTDKIEDLVSHIPQVKYFKYNEKMTLGKKRNLAHDFASGDILVYMDDDDYYPSQRVKHAVEMLLDHPKILCAGSSVMYIYFKHIQQMYKSGPYGDNHATAATFAFKKELLNQTSYDNARCIAEEKRFLKDYTIPMIQLDPKKTILVFSHTHNSFDKKKLLEVQPNPKLVVSDVTVEEIVKEEDMRNFFMRDIDKLLDDYEPGRPENKPDVLKQMDELQKQREVLLNQKRNEYEEMISKQSLNKSYQNYEKKINDMSIMIQELTMENTQLKHKVLYLEDKLKNLRENK